MAAESKDSLRSTASLSILDLLGEGVIGGLVPGAKSILESVFLNNTPLMNSDGSTNFQGLTSFDARLGENSQTPIPLFGNYIESPYNVGVQVKTTTPHTLTVSSPNTDAVRMIVTLPSLMETDSGSGDMRATTVQYKFQVSYNNGAFADIGTISDFVDASGAAFGLANGYLQATVPGTYTGSKVTISAVNNAQAASGWIDVQAQEYNGAAWVNLGDARRLNVSYVLEYINYETGETFYSSSADTYTVQSNYNLTRFIVIGRSDANVSIDGTSIQGGTSGVVVTVTGKSRARYQRAHVLKITPNQGARIRMLRITADSASTYLSNDTYLDSYVEIVTLNASYPNSALVAFRLDSAQFSSIPSRSYRVDGLYISVRTNYDPATGLYSGVWNGTFKLAVSNNPAWIMYDILTNKRYGLGNFIDSTQIDTAMLYTIGRYCDGYNARPSGTTEDFSASGKHGVPDGFGNFERRFTVNTVINTQMEAFKLLADIASAFRGMSFWDGGMVQFMQDSPADPIMLYSAANVVDGNFNYTGSARKDRHSVVHVTWNDPDDYYRKKIEYVEDAELIAQYGIRRMDTLAFGCTSRGQAARVGKWILYTEKYESDFITFSVGIDSAFLVPGNIIKIHDTTRAGKRMGGRIVSCTSTSVTLDNPVTIAAATATISLMMPTGSFVDRTVLQGPGTYTTLTWSSALASLPVSNALWMLSESTLVPIYARVISISQSESDTFEITAVEHNPSKFDAIENNVVLQKLPTSILDAGFVQIPSQVTAKESIYRAAPGVFSNRVLLSWFGNSTSYEVSYRGVSATNSTNWTTVRVTDALSYEILNAQLGTYEINVTGINPLGVRSTTVGLTYTVVGKTNPPSDVEVFQAIPNTSGVLLSWVAVADEDVFEYEIRQCTVAGQAWEDATYVGLSTTGAYQIAALPSGTTYEWLIKAIDSAGNRSKNAERVSATIIAPSAVTPTYVYVNRDLVLSWSAATPGSLPLKQYEIRQGAAFATATIVGTTTDTTYRTRVTWTAATTFWVVAMDTADSRGTATSVAVAFSLPAALTLTQTVKNGSITLAWNAPTSSLAIEDYEIRYGSSFATGTSLGRISGTSFTQTITWLGARTFWVAAYNINGNVGTASSSSLTVLVPSTPTVTSSITSNILNLTWNDCTTTLPVDFYEVRRGATFDTGTLVAKVYATTASVTVDWTSSATFHVRAVDINGNVGTSTQHISSITGPGSVAPSASFKDTNLVLSWNAPTSGSLAIRQYEIRSGATWNTGTLVGVTSDRSYSIPVNWTSAKTFWVAAIDAAGTYGTAGSVVVTYTTYNAVTNLVTAVNLTDLVLTWVSPTGGSLPVGYYDVRFGGTFASGEVLGRITANTFTIPITWTGSRTFWVTAVDTQGQFGTQTSIAVSVAVPGTPSVASAVVVAKAELKWTPPTSTLPIREYEIRYGASFATGTLVATTLTTNYRAPIDFSGSRTYWVAARDVNGNTGTAGSAVVTVTAAAAPTVTGSFALDQFRLDWTAVAGTLPTSEYEIRYGTSWAAGTSVGRVTATTFSTKAQWIGSRTWWISAIDVNGNVGAAGARELIITAPPAPVISPQVVDNNVLLYWSEVQGTLPTATYDIRKGETYATSTSLGKKSGGFTTVFETVGGVYNYWVVAIDSAGNAGSPASITARVDQPPDYVLQLNRDSDFNGRNFEFSAAGNVEGWTVGGATISASGDVLTVTSSSADPVIIRSLTGEFFYGCERPIVYMRVRRVAGTGWQGDLYYATSGHSYSESYKDNVATGPSIGQTVTLMWDMNSLTAGGSDWMDNRITGVRFDLGNSAADVFEIEYIRFSEYTGTNTLLEEDNTVTLPVNTTETFASHFTSRSWTSPDSQIAAGYPLFIQPTTTPGVFTQIVDYGTVLAATKVTVTPSYTVVSGTPTVSFKISVRATTADAWIDYTNTQSVYATGFRYVKVEMTVTNANSLGLIRLTNVNIKFDAKLKNDAGMGTAGSTDSVSGTSAVINGTTVSNSNPNNAAGNRVPDGAGTLVRFSSSFVDIAALEVSVAAGGSAKYALYDFTDSANPAGFKVLLYDGSGNRVGGAFSWSVRGY